MTIPTIETLERRRSSGPIKLHHPRAVAPARYQTPLNPSDLPTQRISRANRSPPSRAHLEKRKQKILEPQLEAACLFAPVSNFHSRKLPPLGSHALNLDLYSGHIGSDPLEVGQIVKVRRFNEHAKLWTHWDIGTIVQKSRFHGFAGTNARGYIVSTICPKTRRSIERKYAAFLGEICGTTDPEPQITPEECARLRDHADCIFTRLPVPAKVRDISMSRIWVPAYVKDWDDNRIRVSTLAGPGAPQEFDVKEALPFTAETAKACRHSGYHVMGTDGRLEEPYQLAMLPPTRTGRAFPSFSGFRRRGQGF